jgi:fumarate reductase (CoM/CoB) subunit A
VAGDVSHIGKTIMDVLQPEMKRRGIEAISNVMITDLLTAQDGISGALGLNWRDGTLMVFNAKAVVMATGGTVHLYKYTDNPTYMTGDGHAAMYRAGAEMVDMEFCDFQFGSYHPPQMFGYPPNCGLWLAQGACYSTRTVNDSSKVSPAPPMKASVSEQSLAGQRCQILEGRGLTPRNGLPQPVKRTPGLDDESPQGHASHFRRAGIDITWQPMEVAPGNHTYLGGARIDRTYRIYHPQGTLCCWRGVGAGEEQRQKETVLPSAPGLGVAPANPLLREGQAYLHATINERQVKSRTGEDRKTACS